VTVGDLGRPDRIVLVLELLVSTAEDNDEDEDEQGNEDE
jgi:hypothetical protein